MNKFSIQPISKAIKAKVTRIENFIDNEIYMEEITETIIKDYVYLEKRRIIA